MRTSEPKAQMIHECATKASHGIDVLAENQRDFIYEYVPEHSSCSPCYGSHYDIYPYRESCRHALLYPDYGKKPYSYGVEYEEGIVKAYYLLPENQHENQCEAGYDHIRRPFHPERRQIKHHVPQCSAADSCHESHHVCPEPIEILCCRKTLPG